MAELTLWFSVLLVLALAGCRRGAVSRAAVDDSFGVVVGDSVAYGYGSSGPQHNLTSCLERLTGRPFVNVAISGTTTRDWIGHMDKVTQRHPTIVFVSLGGNDLQADLYGKWRSKNPFSETFPEDETLQSMGKILGTLKGREVIYLGINPPRTSTRPQTLLMDDRMARLQDEVAPGAGALGVRNAYEGMWLNSQYMFDDIHPNDRGYALLCDRLCAAMAADPRFSGYLIP